MIAKIVIALVFLSVQFPICAAENWPSPADWQDLKTSLEGRLIQIESPLNPSDTPSATLADLLNELQNPFAIQEYPWGTQLTGWLHAWSSAASPYAVLAQSAEDIAIAVRFAKKQGVKLVIKGTGHDYLGRSNAAHSLLIWTHKMRKVAIQETFIPTGAPPGTQAVPAVTIEAGARWGKSIKR